jgi:hypothetical protein
MPKSALVSAAVTRAPRMKSSSEATPAYFTMKATV